MQYTGPLPPPSIMREFEELVPGSAKQMMAENKKETGHRREIEVRLVEAQIEDQKRAQNHAFYIAMGFLVVAAIAFVFQQQWGAILFGAGGIASVITALKKK